MPNPTKRVRLGSTTYVIAGLSEDDFYFAGIGARFDPEFDQFCAAVVRPDDICLDIGANIGLMSLLLAGHATRGRVVAIEASPTVGRLLDENIRRSGKPNIITVHTAIGDAEGTVRFVDNSAHGHIAAEGAEVPPRTLVEVPLHTLGAVVNEAGVERIDFIKIDVEGYEFPILRNAQALLARDNPVVFLEFNAWCQLAFSGVNPVEFATWLLGAFSHVYRVQRRDGRVILERIPADGALTLVHANLVHDGVVTDIVATNAPERLTAALTAPPPVPAVPPPAITITRVTLYRAVRRTLFRTVRGLFHRAGFDLRRL